MKLETFLSVDRCVIDWYIVVYSLAADQICRET